MENETARTLGQLVDAGEVYLGRGNVISSIDIAAHPGEFPIYSSSAKGSGEFGRYGKYMFDEELITWSVDGGGRPFHRPRHRYSVTNVCGYLRVLRPDKWEYRYLHAAMQVQHARITFDYQTKAHPSVIRDLYEFACPPLPEQRRIAEILDTLDEAIRKTEQVIVKLQRMRQGLVHDLLTRGIDETGELRDPERHPEQFRDSPLGRIPKNWEVLRLGEVIKRFGGLIQTGPFGSQLHAHEYVVVGVPVVMPQDIADKGIDLSNAARITDRKAAELGRHRVRANDAVFARRGDLSRCWAVSEDEVGWVCGTGCLLVRVPESTLAAAWLTAVYRHDLGQRQVLARAVGSTMVNLNGSILATLSIPLPPLDEQLQFADAVLSIGSRIDTETRELAKLRTLKLGLMDDLLTGRVRVTAPEEAA